VAVTGIAAALALLAALLFAIASAVQQRAASQVPDDSSAGLTLIRILVRRRLWWAGIVFDFSSYFAQAAALGFGSLVLVQPLLVTSLLMALPLSARWGGRRLSRSDWVWACLLAVALAVFVVTGESTAGLDRAGAARWVPTGIVLGVLLAGCLGVAGVRRGYRPVAFAAATALLYGLLAALTKSVVSLLPGGPRAVLGGWETYALVAAAVAGTLTQQSAYQAGGLAASLPTITVGEPVVAVVLGIAVLGERLPGGVPQWTLVAGLGIVMATATAALARSAARPVGQPAAAAPVT
jgi:drug/metabolite transporter (DMT)-like permease